MKPRFSILNAIALVALAIAFAACSSTNSVQLSAPPPQTGAIVTGDTLHGTYSTSTLAQGKTYYMDSNVVIPHGDTLLIQSGVTIIMLNTGIDNAAGSPEFQVYGSLICNGTQAAPIYLTVPPSLRLYANLTNVNSNSLWGGIECAAPMNAISPAGSGDVILKWTHIEYAGGSAGTNDPIVGSGGTRYAVWFETPGRNFIMEDSWITGSTDDPLRVSGGNISILRNVVECASPTSGDFNMKSGTTGDIAYNLFIGIATNGSKLANTGGLDPECNVNIYNNTYITDGWRCTKTGRAGSIDIESGARGVVYNNLIVNCRTGYRVLGGSSLADTGNTFEDYDFYYGSTDSIVAYFDPGASNVGGIQNFGTHDKYGAPGANNPMFVSYSVDQFNAQAATLYLWPVPFSAQQSVPQMNVMRSVDEKGNLRFTDVTTNFTSNFNLATGSPCIGKAYTGTVKGATGSALLVPLYPTLSGGVSIKSGTNLYGADYTGLGFGPDFGAFQTSGNGNVQ